MRILILPYNVDYYCLHCTCIYMDSTCSTSMCNDNSVMYHKPMHELYYTGNTIIIELNSI